MEEKYISTHDIYLFNTGNAQKAYLTFGCHYIAEIKKHRFCVWAPNARSVSLVGDFNNWEVGVNRMQKREDGVYYAFVENLKNGDNYKYLVEGYDGRMVYKSDPFAFHSERTPKTASKVWDITGFEWSDEKYLQKRDRTNYIEKPLSIYELHIGSWRKKEDYEYVNIREIAKEVAKYVKHMGFTHVELMPITEYPLDASWGYQVVGYYGVTSRYGTPQDFMYFIDVMHKNGIGVLIDWVPAHFPKDDHGLACFDGTQLFEHEEAIKAEHPQWGTLIFNYGREQVQSFLISSAMFFVEMYHVDGFRIDAVSSMLYLDFGREDGQYIPNKDGGNIDYEAVDFIKKLNSTILTSNKGIIMSAEEATSYQMVPKPPYDGGLGFTFKWNMGFMNDTLKYVEMDPLFRKDHHSKINFSMCYAFMENYVLAFSHDEVVHGKKSMLDKMYGDYWQKFAGLRGFYGFIFAHPGKKLLFMGDEIAHFIEWDYKKEMDWFLLEYPSHKGVQDYVRELNRVYKNNKALYEIEDSWDGFKWINADDNLNSTLSFIRFGKKTKTKQNIIVCASNFTPVVRYEYPLGLPARGTLREILNSDDTRFGGSGVINSENIVVMEGEFGEFKHIAHITLPPLGTAYFEFIPDKI